MRTSEKTKSINKKKYQCHLAVLLMRNVSDKSGGNSNNNKRTQRGQTPGKSLLHKYILPSGPMHLSGHLPVPPNVTVGIKHDIIIIIIALWHFELYRDFQ